MPSSVTGAVVPGYQQFLDANGNPLAGGKVFHYLPGTSTPVTTYSDPDLTIPNTVPVRLDAAGRARIYSNQTLRQVVQTSTGVQVWDTTTVTGFSSNSSTAVTLDKIADLRANTSTYPLFYLLGYFTKNDDGGGFFWLDTTDTTSADNGGTIIVDAGGRRYKRLLAKNEEINARWFGLMGDGVTNVSAAVTQMLALQQDLYFPKGTYYSTSGWSSTAIAGITIRGDGWASTSLKFNGNFDCIKFSGDGNVSSSAGEGCGLRDLRIDATGMTGGYALNINGADRFLVNNVYMVSVYNGIYATQTNFCRFDTVYGSGVRGSYFCHLYGATPDRSDGVVFDHVVAGSGGSKTWTGLYWNGFINTVRVNDLSFVAPQVGVKIVNLTGSTTNKPQFFVGQDFEVDYANQQGLYADSITGIWLSNVYIQGGESTEGMYFGLDVDSVKINNGFIRGNWKEGMVSGAVDCAFVGCQFVFNSFEVYGKYSAVRLQGTANRHQYTACAFGGLQGVGAVAKYGVDIEAGAKALRFAACDFYGCILTDINDGSAVNVPGNIQVVGCNAPEVLGSERLIGWDVNVRAGRGAVATPTITGGVITAVTVNNGGLEYGDNGTWRGTLPTVVAYDINGTGAGAVFSVTVDSTSGVITAITPTAGGANYSANTFIRILPGSRAPTMRVRWPGQTDTVGMIMTAGASGLVISNDKGLLFQSLHRASPVNYPAVRNGATGQAVGIGAYGTDANIDLEILPKGTGVLATSAVIAGGAGALLGYLPMRINGTLYYIQVYGP